MWRPCYRADGPVETDPRELTLQRAVIGDQEAQLGQIELIVTVVGPKQLGCTAVVALSHSRNADQADGQAVPQLRWRRIDK